MKEIVILFFGSQREFKKFEYDNISVFNIRYKLCVKFLDCRAINFDGYIVHHSASEQLQKEVNQNQDLLKHLISR